LFPVARPNIEAFTRVQREAGEIYKRYGALDDETISPVNLGAAYGYAGFVNIFEPKEDEALFIGLSRFRDRGHHDEVMAKVDTNPKIDNLYTEILTLLDMSRVIRGNLNVPYKGQDRVRTVKP